VPPLHDESITRSKRKLAEVSIVEQRRAHAWTASDVASLRNACREAEARGRARLAVSADANETSEDEDVRSESSERTDLATPQVPGVTCDWYDESVDELMNYGTREDDWKPSGGDVDWDYYYECGVESDELSDGASLQPLTKPDIKWPEVDNFCMSCERIRPREKHLSRVERAADGSRQFVQISLCRVCFDQYDQI